ncbi:hypothetical protein [Elizabethkingia anophelis]|uniref:hypothetical protein n=1 Tax=Elizabethkingia anophelis TaxID=1117645 RepID=UPI00389155F7
MKYFKVTFVPIEYGELALTVAVNFNTEQALKNHYKPIASSVIDYEEITESEFEEWHNTEARKKKYQKLLNINL